MSSYKTKIPWVENSKEYYFSATHLKGDKQSGEKARQNFEVTTPQTQCENALDDKVDPGISKCYICGLTIDQDDGSTTGRECEHVLTASTIAMLCGLEGGKKADPYTVKAKALIDEMENNDSTNTKYRTFYNDYVVFQSDLRKDVYDWSHPRCNKIKKDHPYLKIDFKPSGITIYDPSETEDNIKRTFYELFRTEDAPSTTIAWQNEVLNKGKNPPMTEQEKEDLYNTRLREINTKIRTIYDKLNSKLPTTLNQYCLFSIRVMINVVMDKLSKHKDKYGTLTLVDNLKVLYKSSGTSVSNFIKGVKKKVHDYDLRSGKGGSMIGGGSMDESNLYLLSKVADDINSKGLTDEDAARILVGASKDTEITIYDEGNLSNDVIYTTILLLNLNEDDIFNQLKLTDVEIKELFGVLTYDDIVNKTNEEFNTFCIAFRNYMNLYNHTNPDYLVTDRQPSEHYMNSSKEYIKYLWNIWGKGDDIQVIEVGGEMSDIMNGSETVDPTGIDMEIMNYMTLFSDLFEKTPGALSIEESSSRGEPLQEGGPERDKRLQREEGEYRPVGRAYTDEERTEMDRRHEQNQLGSLSNVSFTSKYMGGSYNKKKKRSYKRRVKRTHRKKH
ncbi:hypothetical protein [uncultured Mediterranean phage]|nr:hypothetical protein [uncultured Mediterranean phage]